jgi:hypothetical protein
LCVYVIGLVPGLVSLVPMDRPSFVVHRLVRHRINLKNQGYVQYLLGNRLSRCRSLVIEPPLFDHPILAHPSSCLLGSPTSRVTQCLRYFQPHGRSIEGLELEHQDLGQMLSHVPSPL